MSARETAVDPSLSACDVSMVSRADTNVLSREKVTMHFGFPTAGTGGASGKGKDSHCSSPPRFHRRQKLVSLLVTEASAQRSYRFRRAGGQESLAVEVSLVVLKGAVARTCCQASWEEGSHRAPCQHPTRHPAAGTLDYGYLRSGPLPKVP